MSESVEFLLHAYLPKYMVEQAHACACMCGCVRVEYFFDPVNCVNGNPKPHPINVGCVCSESKRGLCVCLASKAPPGYAAIDINTR